MLVKKCLSLAIISAASLCLSACLGSGPPDGPPSMRSAPNGGDDCNWETEYYYGEEYDFGPGWCYDAPPNGYDWWKIDMGNEEPPLFIGYCDDSGKNCVLFGD